MEIKRLESENCEVFDKIVEWNYAWWGEKSGLSYDAVRCQMAHSLRTGDKLPQTFVALDGDKPVGMYQLSMVDDLVGRPDIYPWLINVYVDISERGKNICRYLMETVFDNAKRAGIKELFLYTSHVGLYEKFGWEFVEFVDVFRKNAPKERLYKLKI